MVLGSGLVARGFKVYVDDDNYLVFASGVSNSANRDAKAFSRERTLLEDATKVHNGKTFIYFSTCSIYDPSLKHSQYVKHKLEMEAIIQRHVANYHIFRISNLVGNTDNPHTVLNFFVQHIRTGHSFKVWKNAARNIVDIDDAFAICDHIIRKKLFLNTWVNIANTRNYPVMQIIRAIEQVIGKQGNYKLVDAGDNPMIDTSSIEEIVHTLDISFDDHYLTKTLRKYYSQQ